MTHSPAIFFKVRYTFKKWHCSLITVMLMVWQKAYWILQVVSTFGKIWCNATSQISLSFCSSKLTSYGCSLQSLTHSQTDCQQQKVSAGANKHKHAHEGPSPCWRTSPILLLFLLKKIMIYYFLDMNKSKYEYLRGRFEKSWLQYCNYGKCAPIYMEPMWY